MSQRTAHFTFHIAIARDPPFPPLPPLNFEILLEYFKYLYFNFYIKLVLIKVLSY